MQESRDRLTRKFEWEQASPIFCIDATITALFIVETSPSLDYLHALNRSNMLEAPQGSMERDHLCSVCGALDFHTLLFVSGDQEEQVTSKSFDFGTLECVIERAKECKLCELVIEAATRINGGEELPIHQNGEAIKCELVPWHFCTYYDIQFEGKNVSLFSLNRITVRFNPAPWSPDQDQGSEVVLQAHWDPDQEDAPLKYSAGSGRLITDKLDTEKVKDWIRRCEHQHGETCHNPPWLKTHNMVERLKVIDVQKRCIVKAPSDCRYVALSYVWGEQELAFKSTVQNMQQLYEEFGLDDIVLPKVIKDAMELVKNLGEKYLWLDAYCILQEDEKEVAHFVGKMDLVYAGALMTVIVGAGENADSGLPGMGDWQRKPIQGSVKIGKNLGLMQSVLQGLSRHLQYSRWNTRGWTFQERLLSRRALIFTQDQLYWECGTKMWAEETILEPDVPKHQVFGHALGSVDEWDDSYPKFTIEASHIYITQYSTRKFTYESDVLPAFLGIISRVEEQTGERFHWAQRTSRLGRDLVWQYGGKRRNEFSRVLSEDGRIHHVPYPSWSWLGWTKFRAPRRHLEPGTRIVMDLDFYTINSDGSVTLIEPATLTVIEETEMIQKLIKGPAPEWKGDATIQSLDIPIARIAATLRGQSEAYSKFLLDNEGLQDAAAESSSVYDTGLLAFWTSHAQACVTKNADAWFEFRIHVGDSDITFKASFSDRKYAHDFQNKPEESQDLDFLAVAGIGGKVCIIIVNWIDEEINLASRVGETIIPDADWLKLKPEWKLVKLA